MENERDEVEDKTDVPSASAVYHAHCVNGYPTHERQTKKALNRI